MNNDLSVKEEEQTNDIPGLDADIYFGDPSIPLPNWREVLDEEDDDSDELSPEEKEAVERMIGFSSDDSDGDDTISMPEVRPSPLNKQGKDLSTAQQPKVDLHGKPCGVGQNQTRDGCIPNDEQSQAQTQQQQPNQSDNKKPGSNYSARFDPSKVQESDKPSEEEVLGTKEPEDKIAQASKEWKEKGTKSKFFKSWFGDWENDPKNASKVVDKETGAPKETGPILGDDASKVMKDGKPIMVYHGTPNSKFDEFRKDKIHDPEAQLYGPGFYFTESMEVADTYREKERPYKFTKPKEDVLLFIDKAVRGTLTGMVPSQHLQSYIDTLKFAVTDNPDPATALNAHVQGLNGQHDVHMDMSSIMEPIGEGTRFNVFLNIRKPFDADKDGLKYDELSDDMKNLLHDTKLGTVLEDLDELQTKLDKAKKRLAKIKKNPEAYADVVDDIESETKFRTKQVKKYEKKIAELDKEFEFRKTNMKKHDYQFNYLNEVLGVKKKDINDQLITMGYDGITHMGGYAIGKGDHPHRVWIAFESNQIKSSENQGTFDPNENDMNKSLLIPIDKALSWKSAK